MVGRKLGGGAKRSVAWGALLLTAGCSGGAVSAGDEGDTINLGRCYGVDCGSTALAATGSEATVGEPCGPVMGTLSEPFEFEPVASRMSLKDFKRSPDGSFWLLGLTEPMDLNNEFREAVLFHYSAEGQLLARSEPLQKGDAHTSMEETLAVDASGNALVAIYSVYAVTADSELEEQLNLYSFAPDFTALGPPIAFRGIGVARLGPDPSGAILLAGNALNNAAHGVIARLENGEPSWIQTRVPTSGQGAGVGVSALVVDEAGKSAVISQRSKRWESGPNVYTYGIATFEVDGMPAWDLVLPTPYESGYIAAMAGSPRGELVVAGYGEGSGTGRNLLVRSVSKTGELGWAYTVPSFWPNVVVDPQTGRTFVSGNDALAVIEADGALCRYLDVPREEGSLAGLGTNLMVDGPFVYALGPTGIQRYELPSE